MNRAMRALAKFKTVVPTLKLVWSASPRWTVVWASLLLIQGLLPGASVYLSKQLVDGLVAAMRSGTQQFSLVLVPGALMAIVVVISELSRAGLTWVRTLQAELVRDHMSRLVQQQSVNADLAFYELPEFHDRLHRARDNASERPLALLENVGGVVQNVITLLTMATILLPYGLWLPIALVASAVPAFFVLLQFNRRYHRWWERTTPQRRQAEYHEFLMTQPFMAAEVRLFNLGDHFQTIYQSLRQQLRDQNVRIVGQQSLAQLSGALIGLVIAALVGAWMLWRTVQGFFTLGDLTLFYQAFTRGQTLVRSVLSNIGQVYSASLYLGNLFEFLQLKPQVQDPPVPAPIELPLKEGIEFRDVTFRYPGSDRAVLENFNLTIPAGKIVAIVGENGAGKSTLIKLLCRFYDPESGAVTVDHLNLRSFALKDWRRLLTVMFQFPVTYQKTVAENIAAGDVSVVAQPEDIQNAILDAGAEEIINRLPQREHTQLGKLFGNSGTDLSGGEWQRIALARAFFRKAPVLVLDEPTSFMDSWAEFDWLERFRKMAKGRTAIVITHRFTLAMRADVIHVMCAGKVVESGTHAELLERNGLYAQSWRTQTAPQAPIPTTP
jgi:ATP-binding cassette subfamily B protein